MSKVIAFRLVLLAIPLALLKFTPPGQLGLVFAALGGGVLLFALLVLPGAFSKRNYVPVVARVLRIPPDLESKRPIVHDVARAKGRGLLYEYRVGESTFVGWKSSRWPSVFRPFAGRHDLASAVLEAHRQGGEVAAYVDPGHPEDAVLTPATDWAMVATLAVVGIAAIGLSLLA